MEAVFEKLVQGEYKMYSPRMNAASMSKTLALHNVYSLFGEVLTQILLATDTGTCKCRDTLET